MRFTRFCIEQNDAGVVEGVKRMKEEKAKWERWSKKVVLDERQEEPLIKKKNNPPSAATRAAIRAQIEKMEKSAVAHVSID